MFSYIKNDGILLTYLYENVPRELTPSQNHQLKQNTEQHVLGTTRISNHFPIFRIFF